MILRNTASALCKICALLLLLSGASSDVAAQIVPDRFSVVPVVENLDPDAVGFALLPDGRILLVNQYSGQIQLIVHGSRRTDPLVTVPQLEAFGEQGLLGIAVDPDYPDSNYVYVFHTRTDALNRVSRYTIQGDLRDGNSSQLTIDGSSPKTLIEFPNFRSVHNGGTLRFGIDKTLYISHGDDADAAQAQDLTNPFGAILRINRDGGIPADNPKFDPEPDGSLQRIFAMGLRNPYRFAVDPLTGELFIGEVGPEDIEELNISRGGENFGWPRYLAANIYRPNIELATSVATFPIYSYPHTGGRRAVIALVTYRQQDYPNDASFPPEYDGCYFFADFYAGPIQYVRPDGDAAAVDFASGFNLPVDAALAPDGGIYILEYGKSLKKIVYQPSGVGTEPNPSMGKGDLILEQNYPNPFATSTRFSYSLGTTGRTLVSVSDLLGSRVTTLRSAVESAGVHQIVWDGRGASGSPLPAGVYVYRVETEDQSVARMMLIAR